MREINKINIPGKEPKKGESGELTLENLSRQILELKELLLRSLAAGGVRKKIRRQRKYYKELRNIWTYQANCAVFAMVFCRCGLFLKGKMRWAWLPVL